MSHYITSPTPLHPSLMLSLWFCPLLSSPQASHRRDLAFTFAYSTCSSELLLEGIQPRVTDPDARQETHQGALITLPPSRFDESISLCLTASAASPNVLGLSQGQAEGCRKPASDAQFVFPSPTSFSPDLDPFESSDSPARGFVELFQLFCPDSEVVFVFFSHMKIVADLHNLPAASPKSYFTGLPLLSQPSEPGIVQPQHVAAPKCRTAVSGFIMNRCSEQKQQNIKSEAGFKCNRKMSQLNSAGRNSIKDGVSLDCRDDSPLHPRWMSRLSCTQQFFAVIYS